MATPAAPTYLRCARSATAIDVGTLARELKDFTAKLPQGEHARVSRYKRQGRALG